MTLTHWLLSAVFFCAGGVEASVVDPIRYLPVQDAGRIKPYDTFAREALELIHGRTKFKGKEAVEVVTTWLVLPEQWDSMELVEVRHKGLRDALQLEGQQVHYSMADLLSNSRLPLLLQELRTRRDLQEKLTPYFQAVQRLENQITLYQAIRAGAAVRVAPRAEQDTWQSIRELEGPLSESFKAVTMAFVKALATSAKEGVDPQEQTQATAELQARLDQFGGEARAIAPDKYDVARAVSVEVHYNRFHPILWAWVFYLLAAIAFVAHLINGRARWKKWAWVALVGGFLLHTYGMGVRVYLAGRPPVSNMYETVVWVPWGTLVFATIIYRLQRRLLPLIAALVVAVLCLILTDLAPAVLDDSIQPLEPVLRSTFWLSTHVLIITISYAAFFLAFAIGDWVLFCYLRDEKAMATQIAEGVQAIYRAIQIGVVLLAVGIILGGVWADYSWGRFWGWDPKETWALIALLGYIALLHARLTGWVRSFGTAAGAVIAFSLVIMAWYGVNFVLGAGLHSYGFGAGGVEYVSAFVMLHILYVAFALSVRRSRLKSVTPR